METVLRTANTQNSDLSPECTDVSLHIFAYDRATYTISYQLDTIGKCGFEPQSCFLCVMVRTATLPLSYFPKSAPYKLPCPDTRHNHNYFQRTIRNQPTTAITVKPYLLRIKFFSNYIALQDFKLPLGRKPCGAELNRLLPGVPRSTSSYAITQVLLQKYRSFPTSTPNSPSQLTVLWSASLLSG